MQVFTLSGNMRRIATGIVFAVALCGCAQTPQKDATIGSVMTPGNTQVPLPPGDWKKLAVQKTDSTRNTGGGTDNLHLVQAYYGLIENDRLASLVYVSTSADAASAHGYNPGASCKQDSSPEKTYLHEINGAITNYSDCVKVERHGGFRPPSATSSLVYKAFYPTTSGMGGVPRDSIVAIFDIARERRYLHYEIYFFPERDSIQGDSWSAGEEGPAEKAYVHDIVSWAKKFRPAIRNGAQNSLQ